MHPCQTLHRVDDSETVGTLKLVKNRSDGEVYVTEHVYTLLVTISLPKVTENVAHKLKSNNVCITYP